MANNMKKIAAAAMGIAALQNGVVLPVAVAEEMQAQDKGFEIATTNDVAYDEVANVQGTFRFDQTVLTPSDSVFSLFGTAATAACAAPSFVFEDNMEGNVDYYINVGGKLEKNFQMSLSELKEQGKDDILKCSCSMSPAIINVEVTGVPLQNVAQMANLEEDINTVIVKSSDGYTTSLSLKKAIENNAMLVYKVGGEGLKPQNGGPVQLWMPGTAASYFTRQVTDIEFTHTEEEVAEKPVNEDQRAKINVLNAFENSVFPVGTAITFEGYADDFDVQIAAIEFSMDDGKTWTSCETKDTSVNKWVYWYFTVDAQTAGTFKLDVRSKTADGKVSPMASSVVFTVK